MKIILLAGIAGFAGTVTRYIAMRGFNHLFGGFPWGTLIVNVAGSFLAGFLFVLCRAKFQHLEAYFPILFIGFLGAFTTFSTFALESGRLFLDAQYGKFVWNIVLQNGTGILAACGGLLLASYLFNE